MATITVTVYKINGNYFPQGCERTLSCGQISSLKKGVLLELPTPPLTCDEDAPEPVLTELIELDNGELWNIGYVDGDLSIVEKCINLNPAKIVQILTEDSSIDLPEGRLMYRVAVQPEDPSDIFIGTTLHGDEIMAVQSIGAGEIKTALKDVPGPATIYFEGIVSPTKVWIYSDSL